MANLSFSEKQLMESIFNMEGGYVLDFSNREFEEFMKDVINENIYDKYPGLSKAKMLRRFWEDYSDPYIGKCTILLLNYMKEKCLCNYSNEQKIIKLYEWAENKLGRTIPTKKAYQKNNVQVKSNDLLFPYEMLQRDLLDIESQDTQQKKGYAFESYLNKLFTVFNMNPRASYRTDSDQIDGSFVLDGNTILLEAKYRNKRPSKDDLILFQQKIQNKSPFVKGIFITLTDFDDNTINQFKDRASRVIIMTVLELFMMCEMRMPLSKIIQNKFRYLDETGCIFRHFSYL